MQSHRLLVARSEGSIATSDTVASKSRSNLEKDLTFLGLVFFRNELKPCTSAAIRR